MLIGEMTVIENAFELEFENPSDERIVKFATPAVRGVPVIEPLEARARPEGSVPALRLNVSEPEPPLAAIAAE